MVFQPLIWSDFASQILGAESTTSGRRRASSSEPAPPPRSPPMPDPDFEAALDERGDHELAACQRWLAARRKWPDRTDADDEGSLDRLYPILVVPGRRRLRFGRAGR